MRLKHPSERRPELPRESALTFYPRFIVSLIGKNLSLGATIVKLLLVKRRVERDAKRHAYTDVALTPVSDDEQEAFDLLTVTTGAQAAIAHQKKVAELTRAVREPRRPLDPLPRPAASLPAAE